MLCLFNTTWLKRNLEPVDAKTERNAALGQSAPRHTMMGVPITNRI